MILNVDYIDIEKDKPVMIRLRGEDLSFIASNGALSLHLSEEDADQIAFKIQNQLQLHDKEYMKDKV